MTRPAVQNARTELRRCFQTERGSVLPTPCTSTFIWGINDSVAVVATSAACGAGSRSRVLYLGRPEGLRLDGAARLMQTINALIAAGQTDPGRHRNVNEDRFHCDAARGHFIVIDGVGGQAAGGRAADVALSVL